VSTGLPNRPIFSSQEWIDRFRANQLLENHQHPYGSKPPGKCSATVITPKPHLAEGHRLRSWLCKPTVEFVKQKHAANTKAEREQILYSTKLTLEQRLAAIPPLTYTPIVLSSALTSLNLSRSKKRSHQTTSRIFGASSRGWLISCTCWKTQAAFRRRKNFRGGIMGWNTSVGSLSKGFDVETRLNTTGGSSRGIGRQGGGRPKALTHQLDSYSEY
jgi:hypothetical protein